MKRVLWLVLALGCWGCAVETGDPSEPGTNSRADTQLMLADDPGGSSGEQGGPGGGGGVTPLQEGRPNLNDPALGNTGPEPLPWQDSPKQNSANPSANGSKK